MPKVPVYIKLPLSTSYKPRIDIIQYYHSESETYDKFEPAILFLKFYTPICKNPKLVF